MLKDLAVNKRRDYQINTKTFPPVQVGKPQKAHQLHLPPNFQHRTFNLTHEIKM